ncbi:MAG: hypothetical protein ACD_24C00213G0015 [uncultured bacterium]|nr:MAG: hypothetical protein ACD_24C00213G0015 [uncultured bacterium]
MSYMKIRRIVILLAGWGGAVVDKYIYRLINQLPCKPWILDLNNYYFIY